MKLIEIKWALWFVMACSFIGGACLIKGYWIPGVLSLVAVVINMMNIMDEIKTTRYEAEKREPT